MRLTSREDIKIKRIDDLVIVVADNILQRKLPKGKEDKVFKRINKLVTEINSGLISGKILTSKKQKLLEIMVIQVRESKIKESDKKGKQKDAYDLAEGNISNKERKKIMKRVATVHDKFEYNIDGYTFLKDHSIPLPLSLANAILDAHYNENSKYTVESLINFWQWTCLNPNSDARIDLFGWFDTGDFSITESGLVVAYRCVAIKKKGNSSELNKFVENSFIKIKGMKKSPKNYAVLQHSPTDFTYINLKGKDDKFIADILESSLYKGIVSELYADLNSDEAGDVYTDNHTRKMIIKIGEEVSMPRKDCDEERENSCSRGLHFMSKKYGLRLGDQKLIVLVNPMNIVAFPSYDNTKGRCCAYLPVAKALEDEKGDFKTFDAGTYDLDYAKYSQEELKNLLSTHSLQELKDKKIINAEITSSDLFNMKDHFSKLLNNVIDVK